MDSNVDSCWDFLDYNFIDENPSPNFLWPNNQSCSGGGCADIDFSSSAGASQEKECSRKRGRSEACSKAGSKACRERLRRERLNDRSGRIHWG